MVLKFRNIYITNITHPNRLTQLSPDIWLWIKGVTLLSPLSRDVRVSNAARSPLGGADCNFPCARSHPLLHVHIWDGFLPRLRLTIHSRKRARRVRDITAPGKTHDRHPLRFANSFALTHTFVEGFFKKLWMMHEFPIFFRLNLSGVYCGSRSLVWAIIGWFWGSIIVS